MRNYPTDTEIQECFDYMFSLFADYERTDHLASLLKAHIEKDRDRLGEYHFADPTFEDMFLEIFLHENPLALILITHLYIETICDKIVNKILPQASEVFKNRRDITFSLKLDIIRASGKVPKSITSDIKNINVLRNQNAHNLGSSIEDFDFSRFTFCKDIYSKTNMVEFTVKWELHMYVLRYIAYFIALRLARDTRLIRSLKGRKKAKIPEGDDIPF
jgi:hypothetical protein